MNIPCLTRDEGLTLKNEYEFKKGIPGFEQYTKYIILEHDEHFSILQSVENKNVAFIITNPFFFFKDYEFELTDHDVEQMSITNVENVAVRSIVTWGDEASNITINLAAPLIFNLANQTGKQIVLFPTEYHAKHSLFAAELELESEAD